MFFKQKNRRLSISTRWMVIAMFCLMVLPAACMPGGKKYPIVEIKTSFGDMYVWLYDDTPLHKENFLKRAREGAYDNTKFHRVIRDFMVQGGDANSKNNEMRQLWGVGDPGYTLPAEILPVHYHKKGAIAAARLGDDVNPEKRSDGAQFYFVQGQIFNAQALDLIEKQIAETTHTPGFKFSEEARKIYQTTGGTPHLDMQYTVFGEVIQGVDIIDDIAGVQTGMADLPVEDVIIDVNVLELSAKQIKKKFNFIVP